ncbi:unnamed protein product [Lota lota]
MAMLASDLRFEIGSTIEELEALNPCRAIVMTGQSRRPTPVGVQGFVKMSQVRLVPEGDRGPFAPEPTHGTRMELRQCL